jgi:sugar porter (SP) family MFS transporter
MGQQEYYLGEPVDYKSKGFVALYFAIIISFLNSAINGYDLSLMGGLFELTPYQKFFGPFSPSQVSILFAILQIGSIVGCLMAGGAIDYFGRRLAMAVGSIIIIVGAALEVFALNLTVYMIGRFLIGYGVVYVTTAAPTYVVEISHPVFRGRSTAFYNTGWNVGAVPASILLYGMTFIDSNLAWQLPCALQAVFSVIVLIGCMFIPPSPRWLVSKGRVDEARNFLIKYHANGKADSPVVTEQLQEIENSLAQKSQESSYLSLFKTAKNRYRLLILFCVGFFSQYAGNWIAGYFLPQVTVYFGVPKEDKQSSLMLNSITACIAAVAGFYGSSLADKVRRRTLLLNGTLIFAFCYGCIMLSLGLFEMNGTPAYGIAAFVFLQFFSITYSIVWTPLNALYPVECLDTQTRAVGMSFCQFFVNAANVFQAYVLSYGLEAYKWRFFAFFLCFNLMAAFIMYKFFPETKGRTLEEIETFFNTSDPVKASLEFEKRVEAEKK